MCHRTGKYTVFRRVPASSSPEILQAWAVKGLRDVVAVEGLNHGGCLRAVRVQHRQATREKLYDVAAYTANSLLLLVLLL